MDMKWGSWAALMVVATLGACGDSSPPRVDHDSSEEVVGTVQQALGGAGPTLEDLLEDFPELEYREVTFARDNSDYFVLPNPTPFTASAATPQLRRANGFLFNVPSQRSVTLTFNVGNSGLTNNPAIDIAVRNPSGAVVTATPSVVPSDHAAGQLPTTVTLGTLPAGNYELDVLPQSAALTYTVSITAGVPLSFRDGADLAQPGTSVYFFVPAEVETAFLLGAFDPATPIQFFPPSATDFYTPGSTAVTPLTINDRVYAIDTKAKPGVWKATYRTTSSAAHFVNLPDLFSVTPAGVIASKRIRTAMVSTTGGATVSVNSPYYRYNNRFAFYLDEESSPQFFLKAEGENPPGFIVSLLDANGNHLGNTPREVNPSVNEPVSAGAPLAPGYYELHVKNQNIYNRYYITVPPNVPFVSVDGYGLGNVFFPSYRGWFTVPSGVTSVRFAAKPGSTPITVYNGTTLVSGQPTSLGNNIFEIATPTPGMWAINMKGEYWSDIRLLNLPQIISFNQNLHMTVAPSGPVHCTTNADCSGGDVCGTDNGEQFGLAATDDICWPAACWPAPAGDLCGSVLSPCGTCPVAEGDCTSDADCPTGLACWHNSGRHFDKPANVGTCAPSSCQFNTAGQCGAVTDVCGRCDGAPRPCTSNGDCVGGEVCGSDNANVFDMASGRFCWPIACQANPTTSEWCGEPTSPCGRCDCSDECAEKTCGADPSNSCGGVCAGLCDDGEEGCLTNADCSVGSVCGHNIGERFGLAADANVCWPAACAVRNTLLGSAPVAGCGTDPVCVPDCSEERLFDGCGGFCGELHALQQRGPDGTPYIPISTIPRGGAFFPDPLPTSATSETGALPGFFDVSNRGAPNYTIPIEVPPGRLGIQPGLALKYLGTKADGMLGVGWGLTGISSVVRCRSTNAQPPHALRPVMLDDQDRFCLDGEMLLQVSGTTYGADGAEYRLERDMTRLRITSHSEGDLRTAYFTAIDRDGRKLTFGKRDGQVTASNGVRRVWSLSDVEDTAGNFMAVTYMPVRTVGNYHEDGVPINWLDTGELLVYSIAYGGSHAPVGDVPAAYSSRFVTFKYDQRPDPAHHYTAGDVGFSNWRLRAIETWAQGAKVKTYRIDYQLPLEFTPGSSNIPSKKQIEAIHECAVDPADDWVEKCKPPTRFDYYGSGSNYQQAQTMAALGPTIATRGVVTGHIVLDANGDGRDDYILLHGYGPVRKMSMVLSNWVGSDPSDALFTLVAENETPGVEQGCFSQESVIDFNRDGKDDLIALCEPHSADHYRVWVSSSGATNGVWGVHDVPVNVADVQQTRMRDFDGDGLKDLIATNVNWRTFIHLNTGASFDSQAIIVEGKFPHRIFDVDGDGDDDLVDKELNVWRTESEAWESLSLDGLFPTINAPTLDFNGDGLRDILSVGGPSYPQAPAPSFFVVGVNTGKGFDSQYVNAFDTDGNVVNATLSSYAIVFDVDGDGADDIVDRLEDDFIVYRLVDRGRVLRTHIPAGPGWTYNRYVEGPADLNGDGSAEFVMFDGANLTFVSQGSGVANLLSRVTDGLGRQDSVEYRGTYLRFNHLQPGQGFVDKTYDPAACVGSPFICVKHMGPMVSHHRVAQLDLGTSGRKEEAQTIFNYAGAVAEGGGHGWLTFKQRRMEVVALSTTTIDYFDNGYRLAGLPREVTVRRLGDAGEYSVAQDRIDVTSSLWEVSHSQSNPDASAFPFLRMQTATSYSGEVSAESWFSSAETYFEVDEFNNVTSSTTRVLTPDDLISRTVTTTPRLNDVHGGKIGLVDYVEIESTRGADTRTRKTDFGYDSRGVLTSVTRQPDDPTSSTYRKTILEPNELGVVDSVCVQTSDGIEEQRCSSIDLDEWSIFPEAVTQLGEGLTTEFIYGAEAGQLLVATEPNGVSTSMAYDAFGRPSYVNGPNRLGPIAYLNALPQNSSFAELRIWGAATIATQFIGEGTQQTTTDAFGRTVQTKGTGLNDTQVSSEALYDEFGRIFLEAPPHAVGSTTQGIREYRYDAGGALEAIIDADGLTTTTLERLNRHNVLAEYERWVEDFDAADATVVTLPRGNRKITAFDASGNVVRTFDDPNGLGDVEELSTRFIHGPFDVVERVDTPKDSTQFIIDDLGRRETVTATATGSRTRVYNGFDEVIEETDGNLDTTYLDYDRAGRLVRHFDASDATIARWEHDDAEGRGLGKPFRSFRRSSPGSTTGTWTEVEYEEGALGRHIVTKYRVGAEEDEPDSSGELFEVSVGYDLAAPWQVDSINYPSNGGNFQVRHDYDGAGNLRAVNPSSSASAYWQLTDDDEGLRPAKEVFGNEVETLRTYYALGSGNQNCALDPTLTCLPGSVSSIATKSSTGTTLRSFGLAYDANSNVKRISEGATTANLRSFEHDGLDRITSEHRGPLSSPNLVKQYEYDAVGNMRSQTGLPTYEYGSVTSRLTSVGSTDYLYDGNGNQIERIGALVAGNYQELDLNELELPWHITQGEGSAERDIYFEYSSARARVVKREEVSGGERVTVSIEELYERVTTPNGVEHHYRIWGLDGQVAQLVRTGATEPGQLTYLHADQLGSPRLLTDEEGDSLESRDFDPFGGEAAPVDWDGTRVGAGFTSHRHDSELGLINMKGRLYDPVIGRFTSADPFVGNPYSALGWDRYAYVENNPLARIDPTGFLVRDSGAMMLNGEGVVGRDPAAAAGLAACGGGACLYGSSASRQGQGAGPGPAVKPTSPTVPDGGGGPTAGSGTGPSAMGPSSAPAGGPAMGQPSLSDPGGRPTRPDASSVNPGVRPPEPGEWVFYGKPTGEHVRDVVKMFTDPVGCLLNSRCGPGDTAIAAASIVGMRGVRLPRNAPRGGGRAIGAGGADIAEATVLREISHGEKIADLVSEVRGLREATNLEFAVVSRANGTRALVYGGREGIDFTNFEMRRLLAHSHPLGYATPSDADFQMLEALGQRSSWILENGLIRFGGGH